VFKCEIKDKLYVPDSLKDGVILDGLFIEGCIVNDCGKLQDFTSKQLVTKCRYIE
jgi:hypothetical protein